MPKLRKRKLCDLAAIQLLTHCQALLLSKFGGISQLCRNHQTTENVRMLLKLKQIKVYKTTCK